MYDIGLFKNNYNFRYSQTLHVFTTGCTYMQFKWLLLMGFSLNFIDPSANLGTTCNECNSGFWLHPDSRHQFNSWIFHQKLCDKNLKKQTHIFPYFHHFRMSILNPPTPPPLPQWIFPKKHQSRANPFKCFFSMDFPKTSSISEQTL